MVVTAFLVIPCLVEVLQVVLTHAHRHELFSKHRRPKMGTNLLSLRLVALGQQVGTLSLFAFA